MVKVKVTTQWQGKVAVRQGYIDEAVRRKEGLIITFKKDKMVIPADRLPALATGVSEKRFPDYYGLRKPELLIYFKWAPTSRQGAF